MIRLIKSATRQLRVGQLGLAIASVLLLSAAEAEIAISTGTWTGGVVINGRPNSVTYKVNSLSSIKLILHDEAFEFMDVEIKDGRMKFKLNMGPQEKDKYDCVLTKESSGKFVGPCRNKEGKQRDLVMTPP